MSLNLSRVLQYMEMSQFRGQIGSALKTVTKNKLKLHKLNQIKTKQNKLDMPFSSAYVYHGALNTVVASKST